LVTITDDQGRTSSWTGPTYNIVLEVATACKRYI